MGDWHRADCLDGLQRCTVAEYPRVILSVLDALRAGRDRCSHCRRQGLVVMGIDKVLPAPLLVYLALTVFFAFATWLVWLG